MFAFIARQPILDREKDVFGYELLFRDGKSGAYPSHDADKARYIAEHFHTLGLDDMGRYLRGKNFLYQFPKRNADFRFTYRIKPGNRGY